MRRCVAARDRGEVPAVTRVCKIVGADVECKADTSRIKKLMNKLGFEKREFDVNGERFRAYARAS